MNDDLYEMYSQKNLSESATPSKTLKVNVTKKGAITDLLIDGKEISIIDPSLVMRLEKLVTSLEKKILKLENDLKNSQTKINVMDQNMKRMRSELSARIDKKLDLHGF